MTTITWNISVLNCLPQSAEGADYVVTAHWQCTGVDGDYTGQVYSTTSFPVVQGPSFTPYAIVAVILISLLWPRPETSEPSTRPTAPPPTAIAAQTPIAVPANRT